MSFVDIVNRGVHVLADLCVNGLVNEITNGYYHKYHRCLKPSEHDLKQVALKHYNAKVCLYNLATVISVVQIVYSCFRTRIFGALAGIALLVLSRQVVRISLFDSPNDPACKSNQLFKNFQGVCETVFNREKSVWSSDVADVAIAAAKAWRDLSEELEYNIGFLVIYKKFVYLPPDIKNQGGET